SEDMCFLNTHSIKNGDRVRGHQCDGVRARRYIALADAPIVERHGSIALAEDGAAAMPHRGGITEPHDEQQGGTAPLLIPIDPASFIFNERHAASISMLRQKG